MENPRCMRCGEPLVKVSDEERITPPFWEESEGGSVAEYKCPHCLTYYTVYPVDPEEKEHYPAYNKELEEEFCDSFHGYEGECPECGNHIIWQSDFMRSEVWGDVEDDEDTLASYVVCPYCGAMIEIVEATEKEKNESKRLNTETE